MSDFVPRVNQLDAVHLDNEVYKLLRGQFLGSIQKYAPTVYFKFQPEWDLFLQSVIWFTSVGRQFASFGQEMLLICYSSDRLTKSRLCLHFILTVLPKYIKSNTEQRFINKEWLHKIVTITENLVLILSILNFFRFLKTGKKPTLIDFLLGLDYIAIQGAKRRQVGYDYMNRELLWAGLAELFGVLLPLINYQKIRRIVRDLFRRKEKVSKEMIEPHFTIHTTCACCGDRPTLPQHIGCGHVFCYYCIHANLLTDSEYTCPICGFRVIKILPVVARDK